MMGSLHRFISVPVLIIILVLIVAGVAYFVTVRHSIRIVCTQETKQCSDGSYVGRTGPTCEFTSCPIATTSIQSKTADWKTYRNEQYGFEVKYPKKFLDCGEGGWGSALISVRVCEKQFSENELWQPSLNFGTFDKKSLSIDSFLNEMTEPDYSFYEDVRMMPPMPLVKEKTKVMPVGGFETYKVIFSDDRGIFYIFADNYVYGISWSGPSEYKDIADQILSTFNLLSRS